MKKQAILIHVRGRVQGVGYRAWLCGEARARGLEGWVRNRLDGSVEALLQGEANALADAVETARGPAGAQVTAFDAHAASGELLTTIPAASAFAILPTA